MQIEQLLKSSDALEAEVFGILGLPNFQPAEPSVACIASVQFCLLSLEHGRGLRTLVGSEQVVPALCLLRPQFEALLRAAWTTWVADERQLELLATPLTASNESELSKQPMVAKMLQQLHRRAPAPLVEELLKFKDASGTAMNGIVHAGAHARAIQAAGFPVQLVDNVVRQSNALLTMAGMLLALLCADKGAASRMRTIQKPFEACLPQLLAPVASAH